MFFFHSDVACTFDTNLGRVITVMYKKHNGNGELYSQKMVHEMLTVGFVLKRCFRGYVLEYPQDGSVVHLSHGGRP